MPITTSTALTPLQDLLNSVVAEANAKVQTGSGSVSITTAGVAATDTISFSPAYSSPPIVLATARTGSPTKRGVSASIATTTGCTITAVNEDGTTAVAFAWIAVGS